MKYNFDKPLNRRNTKSVKYEAVAKDVLPMWVADMDFSTPLEVLEAIRKRAEHGAFGYVDLPESYYLAQVSWWKKRYQVDIKTEWIEPCTGVIPSLSACVAAFTHPGEKVMIQTPVYNYFNTSIVNNGCEIVLNELVYKNGKYSIDFKSFEEDIVNNEVKVFILCNPHNPIGKSFTKVELQTMGDICLNHNVIVVSDEIHGDLMLDKGVHTPFMSVDRRFLDRCVTCSAPSKTFNLAGLKNANMIIANQDLKKKVNRASNDKEIAELNIFGVEAMEAAYNKGEDWLDQLLEYLSENRTIIRDFIKKELPMISYIESQATYLAWLDCKAFNLSSNELMEILEKEGRVRVSSGSQFGEAGNGFIRLNFACSKDVLIDGLQRIKKVFSGF